MKLGCIVDVHGKDLIPAIEKFNEEQIDYLLVNGNLQGYDNKNSFEKAIDTLANNLKCKALVIPGSHESKKQYNAKMKAIVDEFENIIDMNFEKTKALDSDNVVVSYGGATWTPIQDAFSINPFSDVSELALQFHKNKNKNIILQMHEPPKGYGDVAAYFEIDGGKLPLAAFKKHPKYNELKGLATVQSVGDMNLAMLIEGKLIEKMPMLATYGHIHESHFFQNCGLEIGTKHDVKIGKKVKHLALNPGPYLEGRFSIVELDEDKAEYSIYKTN